MRAEPQAQLDWQRLNQNYLNQAFERIQAAVERQPTPIKAPLLPVEESILALPTLCRALQLSEFEQDVLLLCAGSELVSNWSDLCAQASGNPQCNYPTFSLAMVTFPQAYWRAIAPDGALRYWRLIEIRDHPTLVHAPLRLDERILHYIMGVQYIDVRLRGLLQPVEPSSALVSSHQEIVDRGEQLWRQGHAPVPVLQLCGANEAIKRAIALELAQRLNANLYVLSVAALATQTDRLEQLQCLLAREWHLSRLVLLMDFDYTDKLPFGVTQLIETLQVPLIISTVIRYSQGHRTLVTFDIEPPTIVEQQELWEAALPSTLATPDHSVQRLTSHFNLTPGQIRAATLTLQGYNPPSFEMLWTICRTQSRPRLDELAQRIEAGSDWSDLVLPEREQQVLQTIAAQVRQRLRVYQDWGFGSGKKRGLGITALFAGASGTGKTMAAEAIAAELKLDLYRIDLSSIISKYIGETEKNLRKLFDAAEGGGVILLFDEADALFGKRSEVKDSRDRHANVEVAYLLQRLEAFQGLAILTTNLKNSLDQAFLRRIRFVINFPFPKAAQREEIWRRVFPEKTPTKKLDPELLAQLEVAGGNIKSIAMNAAFLAAEADEPIQMKHLLQAARSEYIKIEKVLTDAEIRDWVN